VIEIADHHWLHKFILMLKILLLILLLTSNQVSANGITLAEGCTIALEDSATSDADKAFKMGGCLGIVIGVLHTMSYMVNLEGTDPLACFPANGVENIQAIKIVNKYLIDHPESLHEREAFLVMMSFIDAFPCPNQ